MHPCSFATDPGHQRCWGVRQAQDLIVWLNRALSSVIGCQTAEIHDTNTNKNKNKKNKKEKEEKEKKKEEEEKKEKREEKKEKKEKHNNKKKNNNTRSKVDCSNNEVVRMGSKLYETKT